LEAADAVAERILALAVPLRVAVAITDGDVNATYRLRFEVASEMGWISDPADPDGFEKDSYDDGAIHIGAWDGALLGGTQRIILPAPGRLLPLEHSFGLEIEPRGQVVHADRAAIIPRYRGRHRHILLAALMSRSWLEWRSRGFHHCTGVITEPLLQVYREIGLDVELLGEPRDYCGELRLPARFDVAASAERLTHIWAG
jgi:hypothetical protein